MTDDGWWSVAVEFAGEAPADRDAINRRLSDFLANLEPNIAAVTGCPESPADRLGRYSAQLTVEARSPVDAVSEAIDAVTRAAREAGFPEWNLVKVEAVAWDEFARTLEGCTYPAVVGLAELAELLGISHKEILSLVASSRLPRPYAELDGGPVWLEPSLRRFMAEWDRGSARVSKMEPVTDEVAPLVQGSDITQMIRRADKRIATKGDV